MTMVWARISMTALLAAGAAFAHAGGMTTLPMNAAETAANPESGRMVNGGSQMQLGRYTTAGAQPLAQASDPLDVFVRIRYPRQTVASVGDALRHTLVRSGWRLVEPSALTPQAVQFLALPLPESQRVLGPYRVRDVLKVLLGSTWQWHEDPATRQLWFTLAQGMDHQAGAQAKVTDADEVQVQKETP